MAKKAKNFRLSDDVVTWLEAQPNETETVETALRLLRDAATGAGREWHFIEATARADGVALGQVLGELAAAQFKAKSRKR